MKTITKIEANRSAAVHRKCRVAAYCRVSTEHDDQMEVWEHKKNIMRRGSNCIQSGNLRVSFMMLALLEQKQKFVLDCKIFYRLAAWAG